MELTRWVVFLVESFKWWKPRSFKSSTSSKPNSTKLHITFVTPQPDIEIPSVLHYPYYAIKSYGTDLSPTLGGGDTIKTS